MTDVYLVSAGSYSDYSILAAYDNISDAQAFVAFHNEHGYSIVHDDARIETYLLNPYRERVKRNLPAWIVFMGRSGESEVYQHDPTDDESMDLFQQCAGSPLAGQTRLRLITAAKDKEHAVKIANEKRTQLIASGKWPTNG